MEPVIAGLNELLAKLRAAHDKTKLDGRKEMITKLMKNVTKRRDFIIKGDLRCYQEYTWTPANVTDKHFVRLRRAFLRKVDKDWAQDQIRNANFFVYSKDMTKPRTCTTHVHQTK